MFVYANLLGTWTELTEDDTIDGTNPVNFVENVLMSETNLNINNGFVEVTIKNNSYHVHESCIQFTYRK